jgi:hypothetical protein
MSTKIGHDQIETGTDPFDVVALDATAKYPAADGSQIYNIEYSNIINHPDVSEEAVQDIVGDMVTGNVETGGISVTYDDVNGKLDFAREPENTIEDAFYTGGTVYTMSQSPAVDTNILVVVDGVPQGADSYSVAGNQLTLSSPAVSNVIVRHIGVPYTYGTVASDSIGAAEMRGSYSRKNYLINGDMSVWQRGTSFPSTTTYTADRWQANSISHSTTRSTDAPDGFEYSLAFTTSNATDSIRQGVEYYYPFTIGSTWTLSFWVKGTVSDVGQVLWNFTDLTGSWENLEPGEVVGTYNITTSWTRITRTFTIAKPFPVGTNQFLISITTGTAISGTRYFTGIQLEQGDEASDFEYVDPATQMMRCQRYYQYVNDYYNYFPHGPYSEATHSIIIPEMRIAPSTTYNITTSARLGSNSFSATSAKLLTFFGDHDAGSTSAGYVRYDWTADAEM